MSEWVLITGGTSPLGAILCQSLAQAGFSLIIHYRQNEAAAAAIVDTCCRCGVEALRCQGDFSTHDGIVAFIAAFQCLELPVNHLINNASLYLTGGLLATHEDQWNALWQVNVTAPLMLVKLLTAKLSQQAGSVVNIGVAGLGRATANTYNPFYMLTKGALLQATRSLARELVSTGVRVNMVSPGHMPHSVDLALFIDKLPMGAPVSCEAVAEAVLFLMSDGASSITGQNIEVV